MRARALRVYLVVGTLAVVGYFLLPDDWWQTSANAAIGLAGAAGLLVGVSLHRPRRAGLHRRRRLRLRAVRGGAARPGPVPVAGRRLLPRRLSADRPTLLARGRVDGLAIGAASMLLFLLVVLRIVGLVRQVEDQAAQLAALAGHDGLTGMPNRRTWEGELPVAMDRARRDGVPLSVAMLDLDHFKRFNDQHGHQAGDRLLKSATAAWSTMLRTTDLLCRYGGEEFSVLLPGATTEQAAEVLERLRAVTPQQQTFSAGLACWDGQEISEELVVRADRALYQAKDAGRDRIVAAGENVLESR
jgi:diguanylate cyclase (GGDEF)-like protein